MKRFIVELGMGTDLHGGDVTKAAKRAVRDAVSKSCLCGIFEVAKLEKPDDMCIRLKICCLRNKWSSRFPLAKWNSQFRKGEWLRRGSIFLSWERAVPS